MFPVCKKIFGPRVSERDFEANRVRYAAPTLVFSLARILLLVSLFLPYWRMTLQAPQYPDGLAVTAYVNHLEGDVKEINALNHYIGMRPLEDAAKLERSTAAWMIIAMALLMEGAAFMHNRWAALLALPAVLFPVGFLVDLRFWLAHFGQNLDPHAPLSAAVKPFVPPVLGEGSVGQFSTIASAGPGWWLAVVGSGLIIVGLVLHRRAYKPLHDRAARAAAVTAQASEGACSI
jgi:hypothetical protein